MKLRSGIGIVAAVSVVVMFIFSCKDPNDNPKGVQSSSDRSLQTIEDSVSYILGMGLSQQYSFFNEDDYRPEMVQKAMNDFLSGEEFKINDAEKKEVLTGYFRWARAMKDRLSEMFAKLKALLAEEGKIIVELTDYRFSPEYDHAIMSEPEVVFRLMYKGNFSNEFKWLYPNMDMIDSQCEQNQLTPVVLYQEDETLLLQITHFQ